MIPKERRALLREVAERLPRDLIHKYLNMWVTSSSLSRILADLLSREIITSLEYAELNGTSNYNARCFFSKLKTLYDLGDKNMGSVPTAPAPGAALSAAMSAQSMPAPSLNVPHQTLKAVENVTLVYGTRAESVSDESLLSNIQNLEAQIESLNKVGTKTKYVEKKTAELRSDIEKLVAILDARV